MTPSVSDSLGHAVKTLSTDLDAVGIITATTSGHTARAVSKHRPMTNVIAVTPYDHVARRLTVYWGVHPVVVEDIASTTDELLAASVQGALASGYVKAGDRVVITGGIPAGTAGTSNFLKIHTV